MATKKFLDSWESPDDDEEETVNESVNRTLLKKMMKGEQDEISEREFEKLPEDQQKMILKRFENEEKKRERFHQEQLERDMRKLRIIDEKLGKGIELESSEAEFLELKGCKIKSIKSTEVEIDATEILDGVVKGDFTIHDIHAAREGAEEAEAKDPVENSPLLLLDNVLEDSVERMKEALKMREPGQFFESFGSGANNVIQPGQMKTAIDNASTAIKLALRNPISTNDAKEAIDSFILATSMNEAEMKMKQRQEIAVAKNKETENLAEIAAVSGVLSGVVALPQPPQQPDDPDKTLGFNITDMNYEISFLPSNDPDVYKPLEIISYIGITNNVL